ncbi:hypothetical protein AZH47_09715 [Corynebacterium striatum]|nr:hypothetical protein AZH47_09715 [Corynebacterium striatum]
MVLWHLIFLVPAFVVYFIALVALISAAASQSETVIMISVVFLIISLIYFVVYGLATLIPNWAIFIRRFHDTGRTMLLPLIYLGITVFSYIIFLIIAVLDSDLNHIASIIFIVLMYAFYIGFGIYALVVSCLDSERKTNKYGPSHKYANQYTKIDDMYREQ